MGLGDGQGPCRFAWPCRTFTDLVQQFRPGRDVGCDGGWDGTIRKWDARTGTLMLQRQTAGDSEPVAFSADGRLLVAGSERAQVIDVASGKVVSEHEGRLLRSPLSPDGRLVMTEIGGDTAHVWETATGRTVAELRGHTHHLNGVAFTPDGAFVMTWSQDNTARVWQVATARSLAEFREPGMGGAAFSPDGTYVVTTQYKGPAHVYACEACGSVDALLALAGIRATRALSHEERQKYLHEPPDK